MDNLIKILEKARDEARKQFIEEAKKFKDSGRHHAWGFCSLWIFMDGRKKISKDIIVACNEINGISIKRSMRGIYNLIIDGCHMPGQIAKPGCMIARDILSEGIGIEAHVNYLLD